MPKFLNRFKLTEELCILVNEAEEILILISPYFKLNPDLRFLMSQHKKKENFQLIIVYGKNEEDKRKSLSDDDLQFFQSFPNVQIRYHKRLHAKMYANDDKCLMTSMNLHDYSMNENIEFGILTKFKTLDILTGIASAFTNKIDDSLDAQAMEFVYYIIDKSTLEFEKAVKKEKRFFGLISKTVGTEITVNKSRTGYCIRTKESIPLNIQAPYCNNAYQVWAKYENPNFTESYCHGCGKRHPSSMAYPLCKECYKLYKTN